MQNKNIKILIAIIIFFSVVSISKNRVVATKSIYTTNHTSINNKSNNYGLSKDVPKSHTLLGNKQSNTKENILKQTNLDNLEKKIKILLGDNIDKFGMVYYDINSKKFIEINPDKQFVAASTIKVPINMLMYDMIQDEKLDIKEKIAYQDVDFEDGAGILQGMDLSKPIAIKTLSDYSIIYSDNIAINMILRKIGNQNKYDYIEKIVGHPIAHKENNITSKDYFKILERLYLNPDENKYYSSMIETMEKTKCNDRIDKYIPHQIVAHKIGDYASCVNDTAIIYKDNPYILVVFTKELPQAKEIIAKVSKMIYDAQE
ncbi:serine hydrolase [Clostridium sp.]|uniref:serine hydrolase n=1 Tax=Clostridium sp. TaxID=1506 RepID=UPI00260AFAE4|nr:serine hydrolase [uncultured Clostridium sp.]